MTADVYPGGSVGTGSGAPALHAGTEYTLAQIAGQCPTVRDVGTGVVAGTTEVMTGVTYSSWPRTSSLADSIVWRDLFRATGPGSGAAVRVGGHDRIDTAIAVARTVTTHAKYAVLARDDIFPDALAGAALAKYRRAPLLLTPTTRLDPRVATYLRADVVHGGTVYLLGGTGALSSTVEKQVRELGLKVTRLGGRDRYATAAAIARVIDPAHYCGSDEYTFCSVVLTDGTDFADALPATTLAGLQLDGSVYQPAPVLYTRGAVMPKVTLDFMNTVAPGTNLFWAYAVGAPATAAVKTTRFSKDLTSFVSSDRYASSSQVFSALHPPSSPQPVAVASGLDFPDAVLGATLGPVLLTTPTALPGKVADALRHRAAAIGKLYVVGTTDVVNNTVASQAQAALSGSTG